MAIWDILIVKILFFFFSFFFFFFFIYIWVFEQVYTLLRKKIDLNDFNSLYHNGAVS